MHLGIHHRQDVLRYKKYQDDENSKFSRECHELIYLTRIQESRDYIQAHTLDLDDIVSGTQRSLMRLDNERKREGASSAEELEVLALMGYVYECMSV